MKNIESCEIILENNANSFQLNSSSNIILSDVLVYSNNLEKFYPNTHDNNYNNKKQNISGFSSKIKKSNCIDSYNPKKGNDLEPKNYDNNNNPENNNVINNSDFMINFSNSKKKNYFLSDDILSLEKKSDMIFIENNDVISNFENNFKENLDLDYDIPTSSFERYYNYTEEILGKIIIKNKDFFLLDEILDSLNPQRREDTAQENSEDIPNFNTCIVKKFSCHNNRYKKLESVDSDNKNNNSMNHTNMFFSNGKYNYNADNKPVENYGNCNNAHISSYNIYTSKYLNPNRFIIFNYDENYLNLKSNSYMNSNTYFLSNTNTNNFTNTIIGVNPSNNIFTARIANNPYRTSIYQNTFSHNSLNNNNIFGYNYNTNLTSNTLISNIPQSVQKQIICRDDIIDLNFENHLNYNSESISNYKDKLNIDLRIKENSEIDNDNLNNFKSLNHTDKIYELNKLSEQTPASDKDTTRTKVIEQIMFDDSKLNLHHALRYDLNSNNDSDYDDSNEISNSYIDYSNNDFYNTIINSEKSENNFNNQSISNNDPNNFSSNKHNNFSNMDKKNTPYKIKDKENLLYDKDSRLYNNSKKNSEFKQSVLYLTNKPLNYKKGTVFSFNNNTAFNYIENISNVINDNNNSTNNFVNLNDKKDEEILNKNRNLDNKIINEIYVRKNKKQNYLSNTICGNKDCKLLNTEFVENNKLSNNLKFSRFSNINNGKEIQ